MVAEGQMTPTQQRMYTLLSDGDFHSNEELHKCMVDELAEVLVVRMHVSNLRRVLWPTGLDIVSRSRDGVKGYYLVRRIQHRE